MTESEQISVKNLIILPEKVLDCTSNEKTGEMVYRVKWFDNLIPESKMKSMFPDLLLKYNGENNNKLPDDSVEKTDDSSQTPEERGIKIKDSEQTSGKRGKKTTRFNCEIPCPYCDEVFTNNYLLEQHYQESHPDTLKYPCKFCEKKFHSDSQLNLHMLVHQIECRGTEKKNKFIFPKPNTNEKPTENVFHCSCCNEYFSSKQARDIHVNRSRRKKRAKTISRLEKVKCDLCDKIVTKKRLESHKMVYHFKNGKFPCDLCDKRFLNERDLQRHKTVHNEEAIQAKKFKVDCDICGKTLTKARLENHKLRFHCSSGEYTCKRCDKKFSHLVDLDWHLSNDCSNR